MGTWLVGWGLGLSVACARKGCQGHDATDGQRISGWFARATRIRLREHCTACVRCAKHPLRCLRNGLAGCPGVADIFCVRTRLQHFFTMYPDRGTIRPV